MMKWVDVALDITESEGDRRRDYGRPLLNFLRIALYENVLHLSDLKRGKLITPLHVAAENILQKRARDDNTFKADNHVDTVGYTNCVDDMNRQMIELGYKNGIQAFDGMSIQEMYDLAWTLADEEDGVNKDHIVND